MILGIDLGSSVSKAVFLDESLHLLKSAVTPSKGNFFEALKVLLGAVFDGQNVAAVKMAITGSGRESFSFPDETILVNDIVALALGSLLTFPKANSVIEIGADISRWLILESDSKYGLEREILDFAMNEQCAAGSGAFLEQQASRLKLAIAEFSALAASAKKGACIAGRCSVFAKSDMIHLQQKGTPLDEIAYGVCLALARNFVATMLKGRECRPPVLFTGGGARNSGLAKAFREILHFRAPDFVTAETPDLTCALGAAVCASRREKSILIPDIERFLKDLISVQGQSKNSLSPLGDLDIRTSEEPSPSQEEFIQGYLGLDVGSVSTNFALVDEQGQVRVGIYLPTSGRPLEVLKEGFALLKEKCHGGFKLLGIGSTGSGRYLAGQLFQADVVRNEITCQLAGTVGYFPAVDTIFEIGGQDSKFISVKQGKILDFTMNKICAAGTGSFLEEQTEPLGIRIENEFSEQAARSRAPYDLGSRCTVFMDTELVRAAARGVPFPDICAGLAFSVARNYIEKVVAGRAIGRTIVFQGGVASNPAVVKAFSLLLDRPIHVHSYNRISGAIGAALLAREKVLTSGRVSADQNTLEQRISQPHQVTSFECSHCSNHCQVNRIKFAQDVIYFGDTCERYTSQQYSAKVRLKMKKIEETEFPDLFAKRQALLDSCLKAPAAPARRIAIPKTSVMIEYLPFWSAFFRRLGCEVVVSPNSNTEVLEQGLRSVTAETCLPIKITYGHVSALKKLDADWIFFPSLVDLHRNPLESFYLCPYSENAPFMVKSTMEGKFLFPSIVFGSGAEDFLKSTEEIVKALDIESEQILDAYTAGWKAQREFVRKIKARGREILKQSEDKDLIRLAVLGRPYNLYDSFLNMNLAKHFQKLEVQALPMDFLPFEEAIPAQWPGTPPWRYNQLILQAAVWCSEHAGVYPVILSNFGCGPDAFNLRHVEKILEITPHLLLEFDEHRAEAGLITRMEAFLDEVRESRREKIRNAWSAPVAERLRKMELPAEEYKTRRFIIPYFSDHAHAFAGALRSAGIEAQVLQLPDRETLELGEKHSTGKECHAYAMIAGDLIKFARTERAGGEVYFFPGAKYGCLLQQYGQGMNYLMEILKIQDINVLPASDELLWALIGFQGLRWMWRGLVAVDILVKAACEIRPYETRKGETDQVHKINLADVEEGLADGTLSLALRRSVERLKSVETRPAARLKVGIAGDIYTRINPVANHNLFLKLEEMGCEVWPSSFLVEGVDFSFRKDLTEKIRAFRFHESAMIALLYLVKELEKWKVRKSLQESVRHYREPTFKEVNRFTSSYIGFDNNQTLLLNIAKMVDFVKQGADGVLNAICFNCMLGTVSGALAQKIRKDFRNIPIPTLIYTGTESAVEQTRLEAFVYQVQQFAKKRRRPETVLARP
jgi:predicted CoA-substrate-specific enzyme activase